jgi:PadR family transcriptional regulator, regulatory protein PadR
MPKPLLTFTSAKVAKVLISQPDAEHWGVGIYRDAGVAAGTVYPMLEHWKARGWITDRQEPAQEASQRGSKGPPRRYWKLTSKGLTELTDYVRRWDAQEKSSRVAR